MKEELVKALNNISYYNAAEGPMWDQEREARTEAIKTLQALVRDADRDTLKEATKECWDGLYSHYELGISYEEYKELMGYE